MLSRKYFGIAGAAMMGTVALVGTNAANAQINLDTGKGGIVYAKETLEDKIKDSAPTAYLLKGKDKNSYVEMDKVGVAGSDKNVLYVTFTLGNGLVFAGAATLKLDIPGTTTTLLSGGGDNDSQAIFTAVVGSNYTTNSKVSLETPSFGLPPDGSGSITITVTNQNLKGILPDSATTKTKIMSGAVKVMTALKENHTSADATAAVAKEFKEFKSSATIAALGSFQLDVNKYLNATTGVALVNYKDIVLEEGKGNDSTMTITGDFSFANMVTLEEATDPPTACSGTDLLVKETVDGVTSNKDTLLAVYPPTTKSHLCIGVSGDEEINAVSYNVVTKYVVADANRAFSPMGSEFSLGSIKRDGTTVQLPYLTTNDRFNQRIYIVNRGSDTTYTMTFNAEGDEKGMDAEGPLPGGGMRTILSLRDDDVVTIPSGRTSTSGTLVIVAESTMIDVATNQINRELGTSDTVVYEAETTK